jgi:DNA polymerase-3 subunit beta
MASLDPKEFPAIVPAIKADSEQQGGKPAVPIALSGKTLREMIEKTLFAASPDETRLNLSGVYMEVQPPSKGQKGGRIRLVASDGHRLALVEREVAVSDATAWERGSILPRKGLIEARKLLEKDEGDIELSLHGATVNITKENTELSMRLLDGDFPDYNQVIPKEKKLEVAFSRDELLSALRRLLVLTTERSRGIKLQIEKDKMEISVNTPDLGEGVEEIAAEYSGSGNFIIGFNGRYLTEMLSVVEEEQKVILFLKDENSPGLLRPEKDEDFSYVIMPMRIF